MGSEDQTVLRTGITTAELLFDFIGKQVGRWRVCAVSADGQQGEERSWGRVRVNNLRIDLELSRIQTRTILSSRCLQLDLSLLSAKAKLWLLR